jgi:hypothetical protein
MNTKKVKGMGMRGPERGCREWGAHLAVRTLACLHPHPPALSPAACWHPCPHTLARALSPVRPRPHALRPRSRPCSHSPTPSFALPDTLTRSRPHSRLHPHLQSLAWLFALTHRLHSCLVRPLFAASFRLVCPFICALVFVHVCPCSHPPAFAPLSTAVIHSSCTYFTYN